MTALDQAAAVHTDRPERGVPAAETTAETPTVGLAVSEQGGPAPADACAPEANPFLAGPPQVLVLGCVPGCGASSVAWSIASAAARLGGVLVTDAASPRRSALRGVCEQVGASVPIGPGVQLVDGIEDQLRVRFIQGELDTRVDDPQRWPAAQLTAVLSVVDVGVSAEEILAGGSGRAWVAGRAAAESLVVLVVPTSAATDARCEAVLSQWVAQQWAPIDQVVAVGGTRPGRAPTIGLLGQALSGAIQVPHLEQLWSYGLPPAMHRSDPSVVPWAAAGDQITAELLHLSPAAPTKRRRFRRRSD